MEEIEMTEVGIESLVKKLVDKYNSKAKQNKTPKRMGVVIADQTYLSEEYEEDENGEELPAVLDFDINKHSDFEIYPREARGWFPSQMC